MQNNVVIFKEVHVVDDAVYDMWWVPVVRGVSAVAFGILVLVWPAATVNVIALIFASLFALYGISDVVTGIRGLGNGFGSILRLLFGILEIGVVIYLFQNAGSGLTLALMGLLMAINLVLLAFVMVGSALLSDVSGGIKWAAGIMGFITLFVGITVARATAISISVVIMALGLFGLITGPIEIASGFMIKSQRDKTA
jgi:hypothetical protein